jgi:hypothetical protein
LFIVLTFNAAGLAPIALLARPFGAIAREIACKGEQDGCGHSGQDE